MGTKSGMQWDMNELPNPRKGGGKKIAIIIISVVLGLCLLGGGAYAAYRIITDNKKEEDHGTVTKYDNGDYLYTPSEENLKIDDESKVSYYNNLIKVYLTNDIDTAAEKELADLVGGEVVGRTKGSINYLQIKIPETDFKTIQDYVDKLNEHDNVLYANYEMPTDVKVDSFDNNPWGGEGNNRGSSTPGGNDWWAEAIGAYTAWKYEDQIVTPALGGVVDNGSDPNHEDFIKDDGNSKITVLNPNEFTANDHATHVAGLMAACNNSKGMRGVSNLSNVYTFDGFSIEADKLMYDNGVLAVNNSWGRASFFIPEYVYNQYPELSKQYGTYSMYYKGYVGDMEESARQSILQIAQLIKYGDHDFMFMKSAGNGNIIQEPVDVTLNGYYNSITEAVFNSLPSSTISKLQSWGVTYDSIKEHVINVAAVQMDYSGNYIFTDFSNYGDNIDIAAPGYEDYSCVTTVDDGTKDTSADDGIIYSLMNGTSMSTPIVTGSVMYLWSLDPNLTAGEIKQLLIDTAGTATGTYGSDAGRKYPMLNIGAAVEKLLNTGGASQKRVYTAVELSRKELNTVTDLMGGDFDVNKDSSTSGTDKEGYYFSNQTEMPDLSFYLKSDSVTADDFLKKSVSELIGEFGKSVYDMDYIRLEGSSKLDNQVYVGMTYNDFADAVKALGLKLAIRYSETNQSPYITIDDYGQGRVGLVEVVTEPIAGSIKYNNGDAIPESVLSSENPTIRTIFANMRKNSSPTPTNPPPAPSYQQKLTVTASKGSTNATAVFYEWNNGSWEKKASYTAKVAKNGIGPGKEGSAVTPQGLHKLGVVLSNNSVNTSMSTYHATSNTCVIDDPSSPYYNQIMSISGVPSGTHYDNIGKSLSNGETYAFIYIEHNGNGFSSSGVVKGAGSAIGVRGQNGSLKETIGDVDISAKDMKDLLSRLNPGKNPMIEIVAK